MGPWLLTICSLEQGNHCRHKLGAKSYYATGRLRMQKKSHCHAAIQLQGMAVQILQERNGRLPKRDFVTRWKNTQIWRKTKVKRREGGNINEMLKANDLGCYTLAGQRGMVDYMLASLAAISSFCIPTIRSWMQYAPTTSSWLLQICRERNPSGIGTDQKDSKPHTRLCFLGRFLQNWKTWVIFELVLSPPYLWTIYFMMGLNDEPNPSPLQNIHQNPSV